MATVSPRDTNDTPPAVADRRPIKGSKNRSSTPRAATSRSGQITSDKPDTKQQPSTRATTSHQQEQRPLDSWKQDAHAGFLRKVYGILTAQMALTIAIAAMCMFTPSIRHAFLHLATLGNQWLQLVVLIPTMASLVCLHLGGKDRYPVNYILLFILTLGISVNVGYICSIFYATGHGDLILQALGVTLLMFLGLSMYAMYAGKDFSFMGGFLSVALWGLAITGLGGLLFPQMVASLLYGLVGALTFCGYILYDTWRLQKVFNYDDYIPATIELYLDIVNLFMYILDILMKLQDKKSKK